MALAFGVFSRGGSGPRLAVRTGGSLLDLHALATGGEIRSVPSDVLTAPTLNPLLEAGAPAWSALLDEVRAIADGGQGDMIPVADVDLHLPFEVRDYVDFYSSIEHATNLGRLFRPDSEPLLPNWRHLPVGYHGRSSTVVVSGTPVRRPRGQMRPADAPVPIFGPTQMLDFELEVGFVTGSGVVMGDSVPVERAEEHIFGLVLVNDWSARDIQAWEYQPLGPFLGKSFATSVSPWVVPLAELSSFRVAGPDQDPEPLPYLRQAGARNVAIELEVALRTQTMRDQGAPAAVVSRTSFAGMYWSMAQQLAHMTVNGTLVRAGDLYASGTVSGAERGSEGSLIELTRRGAEPVELPGGERRSFLEDGDEVIMRGWCGDAGDPTVDFGEVRGVVTSA